MFYLSQNTSQALNAPLLQIKQGASWLLCKLVAAVKSFHSLWEILMVSGDNTKVQ